MPSRRKMCWKLCITVVVPAPDEPVTAMIGCCLDTSVPSLVWLVGWSGPGQGLGPVQRPLVEQRRHVRPIGTVVVLAVIALDALHLVLRAEYQPDSLVQPL